jgi:hypothetical protein
LGHDHSHSCAVGTYQADYSWLIASLLHESLSTACYIPVDKSPQNGMLVTHTEEVAVWYRLQSHLFPGGTEEITNYRRPRFWTCNVINAKRPGCLIPVLFGDEHFDVKKRTVRRDPRKLRLHKTYSSPNTQLLNWSYQGGWYGMVHDTHSENGICTNLLVEKHERRPRDDIQS